MIYPVQDKVCLKKYETKETMVNGLYVPDSAKNDSNTGEVIALGTDEEMLKSLKVGDTVMYSQYANLQEVEDGGETYYIISFSDILCVIK